MKRWGTARSVNIQSDNKIIVGGDNSNGSIKFIVARYNVDGSLDSTFGTSGIAITSIGINAAIRSTIIQTDNKIVAAGFATISGVGNEFALARYNTNGTIDSANFGTAGTPPGTVTTSINPSFGGDSANGIVLQSDSKILLAGFSGDGVGNAFAVARYTTNGVLDTTYNGTGFVRTHFTANSNDVGNGITIQTDDKSVVAGYSQSSSYTPSSTHLFALARYTTSGVLDTTFNGTGKVTTQFVANSSNDEANAVAIQTDGNIIAAGFSSDPSYLNQRVALARYTSTGVLDATFGTGGLVTTEIAGSTLSATGIALQTDGKIVVSVSDTVNFHFIVMRYNTNGTLDSFFGTGGIVITPYINSTMADYPNAVAIGSDKKIVLSGSNNFGGATFKTARYLGTTATITITSPTEGQTVTTRTPTITGTTTAGDTVTVSIDGGAEQAATVIGTNWSFTPSSELSKGPHTVLATATDPVTGDTATASVDFNVDFTFITMTFPTNGETINNARPTYMGTTDIGNTVTVSVDGGTAQTASVDGSGNWTYMQSTTLSQGSHTVQAFAMDTFGSTAQTPVVNFTVDTTTFVIITFPTNNQVVNNARPTFLGTTEVGDTVTVSIDGGTAQTATVDGSGNWSFASPSSLSKGSHTVQAFAVDQLGNMASSPIINFVVDTSTFITITTPANMAIVKVSMPLISGTKESGDSVHLVVTNSNNIVVIDTNIAADSSESWAFTPTINLTDGTYTITAVATDPFDVMATATSVFTINLCTNVFDALSLAIRQKYGIF